MAHPVSVKLAEPVARELDRLSRERGTPKNRLISEAVERYLEAERAAQPLSALALAGDLVGSLSGPGDLSTNPKYMKNYGR